MVKTTKTHKLNLIKTICKKWRGAKHPLPAKVSFSYVFSSWLASILALMALYGVSSLTSYPLVMAPFGASCVLIFGAPDSPLAQPRNVIFGHLIATAIALIMLNLFGNAWWVVALAMGTSIAAMQITRTLHPPAGADPLVAIIGNAGLGFIFAPVLLGALILVLFGVLANNLCKDRHYPKYWF